MKKILDDSLKKLFNPEFLNRIDESIVFHALTREHIKVIIEISTKKLFSRLGHMGLTMEFSDGAKDFLSGKGFDPNYGARPLRRALQNHVEDPLAEEILKGRFPEGSNILVTLNEDKDGLLFEAAQAAKAEEKNDPAEEHTTVDKGEEENV